MGFRKRDVRKDNKSGAAVIMGKPASKLTKEDKKILSARMAEIRKENGVEILDITNCAMEMISEDAIKELPENVSEIKLHTKKASCPQTWPVIILTGSILTGSCIR